jgi:hypothetical protein
MLRTHCGLSGWGGSARKTNDMANPRGRRGRGREIG